MLTQPNEHFTRRILSFDPGVTTGISFLENGNMRFAMIAIPATFGSSDFLRALNLACKPTVVIIEEPPNGGFPSKDQDFVFETLNRFYNVAGYDVRRVLPAFWKNLVQPSKIEANSHIRDATDMAKWFFNKYTGVRDE